MYRFESDPALPAGPRSDALRLRRRRVSDVANGGSDFKISDRTHVAPGQDPHIIFHPSRHNGIHGARGTRDVPEYIGVRRSGFFSGAGTMGHRIPSSSRFPILSLPHVACGGSSVLPPQGLHPAIRSPTIFVQQWPITSGENTRAIQFWSEWQYVSTTTGLVGVGTV